MSKRSNTTQDSIPAKHARKRAGFRVARPTASTTNSLALPTSTKPALFVTVNPPEEPNGALIAQNRVLSGREIDPGIPSALPGTDEGPCNNEEDADVITVTKAKRERHTKNADRLNEWLAFRSAFLDETLRHDGLGDYFGEKLCSACGQEDGNIRCRDCSNGSLLKCGRCTVDQHRHLPLHRVERWTGKFFDRDSLSNLGLCYQLGHSASPCPFPKNGSQKFIVFHINGPHFIDINYCDCADDPLPPYTQLLREKWFPATQIRPKTAFTFECLETFHELTLQGKTSLYDYYNTLLRRFDNAGLSSPINRYSEFHRVFRMWRNLMALKRSGRGHGRLGADDGLSTRGDLMVECPACPHPGKNLPGDWENAGALLFLYTLFVAVDANFKLKGKNCGLEDVELMPGQGAYVPEAPYQAHIASHVDQPEINTCESQHDALVRAATRSSPGYAVSGAVVVICSRHCMVRKNGAGDLQKGEKYCNVDFVIFSALMGINVLRLVLTYDIACQWSKKFRQRMEDFSPEMHIPQTVKVETAIPGWHINGHGESCRNSFNLGYMDGVGRTVGEDVETTWAGTNPLAPSVREMGPAARHDTLNDHWNGWNFRKIVGFRKLFMKRFLDAHRMSEKQTHIFESMSASFNPSTILKWKKMVEMWNANSKAPNPYAEPQSGTTLQDVRLELKTEEARDAALGRLPRHKMSLSTFILTGFELADSQYVLRWEAAQTKGLRTSKQLADLQEKRNSLFRLIENWREVQLVYTPHVASLISQTQLTPEVDPTSSAPSAPPALTLAEDIPLYLPSDLPVHIRRLPELKEICALERRLREPQANDALAAVQRHRRIIKGLWQFKDLNASGVGNRPNTKMVTLYKRFDSKAKRAAEQYRAAWRALTVLDPRGTWSTRLKQLKDSDIRGPGKEADEEELPNSRFEPSWIWLVPRVPGSGINAKEIRDDEFNDSMRVEWAKARARMMRWQEELLLVQEEMRRVIEYLRWRAMWWQEHSKLRVHDDTTILSGISGYAHKQAAICNCISEQCARYWYPRLKSKGITPTWEGYFNHLPTDFGRRAAVPLPPSNKGEARNDSEDSDSGVDSESDDENEVEIDFD